jgi:Gpi18-like mannosyltransferase
MMIGGNDRANNGFWVGQIELKKHERVAGAITSLPLQMVAFAIVSRFILTFVGWWVVRWIEPTTTSGPAEWDGRGRTLLIWSQWDAYHYARIALNGYDHAVDPGNPAFFPLYPLIMRFVGAITGLGDTGHEFRLTGVLVAGVFFVFAVYFLTKLFEEHLGTDVARTAGVVLLVSPFSFFLTAGYTESLFLLLVALTFLLANRRQWTLAAVVVAFATATRVTGVFLIPTLLLLAWKHREPLRNLMVTALISTLGIVSYMAYTWWALGDPIAFLTAQQGWGGFQDRTWIYVQGFVDAPLRWFTGDHGNTIMLFNAALFVACLVALIPMAKRIPLGITVFSALVILQTVVSIQSMGRYLLPAIGVYMVLAILVHQSRFPAFWRDIVLVPSSILLTTLFLLYAEALWIV